MKPPIDMEYTKKLFNDDLELFLRIAKGRTDIYTPEDIEFVKDGWNK